MYNGVDGTAKHTIGHILTSVSAPSAWQHTVRTTDSTYNHAPRVNSVAVMTSTNLRAIAVMCDGPYARTARSIPKPYVAVMASTNLRAITVMCDGPCTRTARSIPKPSGGWTGG